MSQWLLAFTIIGSIVGSVMTISGVYLKINSNKPREACREWMKQIEGEIKKQKESTNEFRLLFQKFEGKFDVIYLQIEHLSVSIEKAIKELPKRESDHKDKT